MLPGTGGTQRLCRMVGKSKAIELMVTGETFSFEEAQELGMINDIFERDGFMENVMDYARAVLPAEQGVEGRRPDQARGADRLGDSHGVRPGRRAREPAELFQSEDAKEGLAAYVEKRPAVFKAK